jgi:putative CocE/NonD family hydrolase
MRMPSPTTEFSVHRDLRVPMRDGVELLAHHYVPETSAPAGTLLVRTPYGLKWPLTSIYGTLYASRGYHVILQSVRGTFGSGGEFEPIVNEAPDGHDTAAWLREQPWFTGSFATMGLSYLGFTQWALLADPPPELKTAIIAVGPHDFHDVTWGRGAFAVNDFLGWSNAMTHQEDPGRLRGIIRGLRSAEAVVTAAGTAPMGTAARELLGSGARWYESWLESPDADAPYWPPRRMTAALDRIEIPVLLLTGWQDVFLDQTLLQYRHLRDRGQTVAMTVGPWTHGQMTTRAAGLVGRESLDWLAVHLGGQPRPARSQVRAHVAGRGWVELPDWPPPTSDHALYLAPDGDLSAAPPASAAAVSFTFDPADPTPTIGGRLLSPDGGYRDDSALAQRSDVAAFTGPPLSSDLTVLGAPVVELAHSCDNPHHDLWVRLSEVDAKGRSHNVSDGFQRFTASTGAARLELDDIAYRFRAGSRLRVLIGGGSFPRFARNLGTDEPAITGAAMVPATHTVTFGPDSRLVLPVQPTS